MRKEFNVRIRLPSHLGDEIHQLSLKENRSQSATVSWLVTRQLEAMRATTASTQKLVSLLRGESSEPAAQFDRRLQLMLLMNCHPCCQVCFSERLDDIISAIESGDVEVHYDGNSAVGIFATRDGMSLLRQTPLLPDAAA
jgi:hypothetical protein